MRAAAAVVAALLLAGCAGLSVDWAWQGQAVYRTQTERPAPVPASRPAAL